MTTPLVYPNPRLSQLGQHGQDALHNPEGMPFADLHCRQQWVTHRNKRPIDPKTGRPASPTDPATWGTYAAAAAMVSAGRADGIGFVFTEEDPFVGIDLDKCRNTETGEIEPWAIAIVTQLNTYTEISPSGAGLHLIARGQLPPGRRRTGRIETYDRGRYFRMSGDVLPGFQTIRDCDSDLAAWHAATFPAKDPTPVQPQPRSADRLDDDAIIKRAERSRNGAGFIALWNGDTTGHDGNHSVADLALMNVLRFWTQGDPEQMERLFSRSVLGQRDKWRTRADYRRRTIDRALDTPDFYDPRHAAPATPPEPTIPVPDAPSCDEEIPRSEHRDPNAASCTVQLATAQARNAELEATVARQAEQILVLQERVRLADEREAIQRNAKLGAARQTGAALATLFREERPKEPDTPAGYRMPLAKLAERTGLSADACSRQLKQLAKYRTPDGTPVLHVKTRAIPRTVNQETGEIIEPHKEVWVGPGPIQHDAFGHVLATLAPDQAPKHGGKPDRNVCPEHPNAGVLRRSRNMRRITHECAHCQKILDTQVVPVGREATEHLRSMAAPPDPIQQDAFAPETDQPPTARPMPQDAGTMGNHTGGKELSSKMRHSPPPLNTEPPDFWIPPDDQYRYRPRGGEGAGNDRWTA